MARTYGDSGVTYGAPTITYGGEEVFTPGPSDVINPPFNDPWKNRHNKRYKWKHGLLGPSYLERQRRSR